MTVLRLVSHPPEMSMKGKMMTAQAEYTVAQQEQRVSASNIPSPPPSSSFSYVTMLKNLLVDSRMGCINCRIRLDYVN